MSAAPKPYPSWPGFDGYYLEDSYVLAVRLEGGRIDFDLEAVLTPRHAAYRPPDPSQAYCYRRATLTFPDVRGLRFESDRLVRPAVDASGERDLGNIDALTVSDGTYRVEGEWGVLAIESDLPAITLTG